MTIIDSLLLNNYSEGNSMSIQGNNLYTSSGINSRIHEIRLNGMKINSVSMGNLLVSGDVHNSNNVSIEGYLSVQSGGQFNNALSVMSNMTVHDDFISKGKFYTKSINNYEKKESLYEINNRVITNTFVGSVLMTEESIIMYNKNIHNGCNIFLQSNTECQVWIEEINDGNCKICHNSMKTIIVQYLIIG
jgi:hypothetical protein